MRHRSAAMIKPPLLPSLLAGLLALGALTGLAALLVLAGRPAAAWAADEPAAAAVGEAPRFRIGQQVEAKLGGLSWTPATIFASPGIDKVKVQWKHNGEVQEVPLKDVRAVLAFKKGDKIRWAINGKESSGVVLEDMGKVLRVKPDGGEETAIAKISVLAEGQAATATEQKPADGVTAAEQPAGAPSAAAAPSAPKRLSFRPGERVEAKAKGSSRWERATVVSATARVVRVKWEFGGRVEELAASDVRAYVNFKPGQTIHWLRHGELQEGAVVKDGERLVSVRSSEGRDSLVSRDEIITDDDPRLEILLARTKAADDAKKQAAGAGEGTRSVGATVNRNTPAAELGPPVTTADGKQYRVGEEVEVAETASSWEKATVTAVGRLQIQVQAKFRPTVPLNLNQVRPVIVYQPGQKVSWEWGTEVRQGAITQVTSRSLKVRNDESGQEETIFYSSILREDSLQEKLSDGATTTSSKGNLESAAEEGRRREIHIGIPEKPSYRPAPPPPEVQVTRQPIVIPGGLAARGSQLAVASVAPRAVVASPAGKNLLDVCVIDLTSAQVAQFKPVVAQTDLLDVSPDGTRLLLSNVQVGGDSSRIDVVEVIETGPRLLASFRPCGDRAAVNWAIFIDAGHFLTYTSDGRLILWAVQGLQALWELETGAAPVTIDLARTTLAFPIRNALILIDLKSGQSIAAPQIPRTLMTAPEDVEFSPDGSQVLVSYEWQGTLSAWLFDLNAGKLSKVLPLQSRAAVRANFQFLDNDYALLDRQDVVSLQHGAVVARLEPQTAAVARGRLWILSQQGTDGLLSSSQLPREQLQEAARELEAKGPWALSPDSSVSVVLDECPDDLRTRIRQEMDQYLAEANLTAADGQPMQLKVQVRRDPPKERAYRSYPKQKRQGKFVFEPLLASVQLSLDKTILWRLQLEWNGPGGIRDDEDPEQHQQESLDRWLNDLMVNYLPAKVLKPVSELPPRTISLGAGSEP